MISITSPTSGSTVSSPVQVQGSCTDNHTITVTMWNSDWSSEQLATPNARTGNWSTSFDNVPAGTYTIEAKCGDPSESATVNNITVE
jgi:hypothetical protein